MLVAEVDPQNAAVYVQSNSPHSCLRVVYLFKETGSL